MLASFTALRGGPRVNTARWIERLGPLVRRRQAGRAAPSKETATVAQSPSATDFTLTPQQRAEFVERGVIKLAGLIPPESVRRGREAVLAPLARLGLWQDGAWRLDVLPRPQWPANGLKVGRKIGHNHPELAALIETPDLIA